MHEVRAATLDTVIERIRGIQQDARDGKPSRRPRWPMIVLRIPKGWTGPEATRPSFIPWRRPIASLNCLLTSHVWRQDHNGFSHQDPGFIDHVINKKADVIRVYLPPDANTLLSVADHCLRSRNYVNVIVAGKQPGLQYLDIHAAIEHCTAGIGIWE